MKPRLIEWTFMAYDEKKNTKEFGKSCDKLYRKDSVKYKVYYLYKRILPTLYNVHISCIVAIPAYI